MVLGLDGETGEFVPLREDKPLPVAVPARARAVIDAWTAEAAE
jgi:carbonic anhydrase